MAYEDKSPEIRSLLDSLAVTNDPALCPTCGKPVGTFRDDLSRREYAISRMCQECQDKVFGMDDEDDECCGCPDYEACYGVKEHG